MSDILKPIGFSNGHWEPVSRRYAPGAHTAGPVPTSEEDIMDNTGKFSNKADVYHKYRPAYPDRFLQYLFSEVGFSSDACVADVGAGTGILTGALVDRVKTVYAIEPNRGMRLACMDACGDSCGFVALEGTAEDTTLPEQCVDYIVAAQAFHWFDPHRAQQEFSRILKPDGMVVLVWNSRVPAAPVTLDWAEACHAHCPGFTGFSSQERIEAHRVLDFFRDGVCEMRRFQNNRVLDEEAFVGTALSASYAPLPSEPAHGAFTAALRQVFHTHADNGWLEVPMITHSYVGRI
jgi:SAM-dependent methyltransferase